MIAQHTYSGGLLALCLVLYSQVAEALQIYSDCIIQKYITAVVFQLTSLNRDTLFCMHNFCYHFSK